MQNAAVHSICGHIFDFWRLHGNHFFPESVVIFDDLVVDKAMKQAGVHRVQNLREMVDSFKAFSLPPPKGPRLAVIARSGGHAVLSADSVYFQGIFVEIYKDIEIRVAPIDEKTAQQMIAELSGTDILKGFREKKPYDVDYLAGILVNISRLLWEHSEIRTLDINPLILFEKGGGGIVVDAKLEIE